MCTVSVIMNCHNGERFLKKSLDSLLNQSYKNWELVFFDNVSKDKSVEIVNSLRDKRIKIFRSKKYLKLYRARNLAIRKASGKLICFLDTDDLWKKDKLQKQISIYNKKKYNMIFCNYFIKNEVKKKTYIFEKNQLPSGYITQKLLDKNLIGIHTVMINKKIFRKFSFNSMYEIIGDYDFFLKLSLKEKFYSIQKPLATYRHHGKNFSLKIDVYLKELLKWKNINKKKFKNFDLSRFNLQLLKIRIKNFKNFVI